MPKILALAAILTALGMASQAAEARDRTFSFGHFSPHASPRLHVPHRGFKFHHRGFIGQPRHFKPRHFRDFGHSGFVLKFGEGGAMFKFGHVPHFKPHRFGLGQRRGGLILKFGQPQHFGLRRHPGFAFDKFRQVAPGHFRVLDRSLPDLEGEGDGALQRATPPEVIIERQLESEDPEDFTLRRHPGFAFNEFLEVAPGHFRVLNPSLPDLEGDRDGAPQRAAPPDVSLERRLEELGFRHVQGLLREFHLPRFGMDQPDLQ